MIAIGCDHGGFALKQHILQYLKTCGYEFKDFGTYDESAVDYPDIALEIACLVASKQYERGILICGTGIGVSIAANKVPGIRAAVCNDIYSARMAKEHNDVNVLTFGGRVLGEGLAIDIVKAWLEAEFQGGRHQIRVDKISEIERKYAK